MDEFKKYAYFLCIAVSCKYTQLQLSFANVYI